MSDIKDFYENECLDFKLMDMLADSVLNNLTVWANKEIYEPLGGE